MNKMKSNVPLDYAVFQLSPDRSRCQLFVSSGGCTEKLESGPAKPFIAHLKVMEEQVAAAAESVKLEVGQCQNAEPWFTKGTLERFVRFVNTPEVLEMANSSDVELSRLEAARRIYSKGAGDQLSGGGGSGGTVADDAAKKELLRAIDLRLATIQQDLSTACAHAAAAGFNRDTVSDLQMFADMFGSHHLYEACGKFISLCARLPTLIYDDNSPSLPSCQEPPPLKHPNPPPVTFPFHHTLSREASVEKDDGNEDNTIGEKKRKDEDTTPAQARSVQESQPVRRVSVQDRINLFENKQKESSGEIPVVRKSEELRRLSSDVSKMGTAAEKVVMSRWNRTSLMNIDLSHDKDGENPLCTPSSTVVSLESEVLNGNEDAPRIPSVRSEIKTIPSLSRESESRWKEGSCSPSGFYESNKLKFNLLPDEFNGLNYHISDQVSDGNQSGPFITMAGKQDNFREKFMAGNRGGSEKLKRFHNGKQESAIVFENQGKLKDSQDDECISGFQSQNARVRDHGPSVLQKNPIGSKGGELIHLPNQREWSKSRNGSAVVANSKSDAKNNAGELGQFEHDFGSMSEDSSVHSKETGSDSFSAQQETVSVLENDRVEKKESHMIVKVSNYSVSGGKDSRTERMKLSRQASAAGLSKEANVLPDASCLNGSSRAPLFGKVTAEAPEGFDTVSTPLSEKQKRVKQPKGNQELNNQLKMKANKLEKLVAEHKLRIPGDPSKSGDAQFSPESILHFSKSVQDISPELVDNYNSTDFARNAKNKIEFDSAYLMKTSDSQNYGDSLNKNFSELSISEGSRGKLYEKYIEKREAKLREDWISSRAEKEAKLKSMQDSLDKNKYEMEAKLLDSAEGLDAVSSARRRIERLRSYNSRSIMKMEQLSLDLEGEDDDETLDFLEKNHHQDRAFDNEFSGGGTSKGAKGKKHYRTLSSSETHTLAAPLPRSATKMSTNSGKRRMQPENLLTNSVPNLSDLRKENSKPSVGRSKTIYSQVRNYARSKTTIQEAAIVKERSRQLQATGKSSTNPRKSREMSLPDSNGVDLTPPKFNEGVQTSVGTKPFLKKGSRAVFVSQTRIPRQKASLVSEPANDGVEEFETSNPLGHKDLEDGEPMRGLESEGSVNSWSENGDGALTFSRVDQALGSQSPSDITLSFLSLNPMQGWPADHPLSWNLHSQQPFSLSREMGVQPFDDFNESDFQ